MLGKEILSKKFNYLIYLTNKKLVSNSLVSVIKKVKIGQIDLGFDNGEDSIPT